MSYYKIENLEQYFKHYNKSVREPRKFWGKRADKTAIIFEPNDPSEKALHITYNELHQRVCKMANVLREQGIKKGDRVCIYLPMIPELAITTLACARIGAIHSVVFAGFSASAVAARINDCDCKMVITSDGGYRGNKPVLV